MALSGAAPPLATLELNCLVFGNSDRLFSVSIANADRVNKVQEAVKKKKEQAFRYVDTNDLKLWKVAYFVVIVNRC